MQARKWQTALIAPWAFGVVCVCGNRLKPSHSHVGSLGKSAASCAALIPAAVGRALESCPYECCYIMPLDPQANGQRPAVAAKVALRARPWLRPPARRLATAQIALWASGPRRAMWEAVRT